MLYMYKKSAVSSRRFPRLPRQLARLMPTILVTIGSLLVANVAWPIIQYNIFLLALKNYIALDHL